MSHQTTYLLLFCLYLLFEWSRAIKWEDGSSICDLGRFFQILNKELGITNYARDWAVNLGRLASVFSKRQVQQWHNNIACSFSGRKGESIPIDLFSTAASKFELWFENSVLHQLLIQEMLATLCESYCNRNISCESYCNRDISCESYCGHNISCESRFVNSRIRASNAWHWSAISAKSG